MPTQLSPPSTRTYVSLSQLAEDVLGISRARLYELIERGAMPAPIYDLRTRRPLFDTELQRQALAVWQTGVGIDGSVVIFYRRERQPTTGAPLTTSARSQRRTSPAREPARHTELISSLQSLGVTHADERTVSAALNECFPNGTSGQQDSEVLRAVFRALRRRESA